MSMTLKRKNIKLCPSQPTLPKSWAPLAQSHEKDQQLNDNRGSGGKGGKPGGASTGTTPQSVHWGGHKQKGINKYAIVGTAHGTTPQHKHWANVTKESPANLFIQDYWQVILNYLSIADLTIVATVARSLQTYARLAIRAWLDRFFFLNITAEQHFQREMLLMRIDEPGAGDDILAQCGTETVSRASLKTLNHDTCLNDEVINFYLKNYP